MDPDRPTLTQTSLASIAWDLLVSATSLDSVVTEFRVSAEPILDTSAIQSMERTSELVETLASAGGSSLLDLLKAAPEPVAPSLVSTLQPIRVDVSFIDDNAAVDLKQLSADLTLILKLNESTTGTPELLAAAQRARESCTALLQRVNKTRAVHLALDLPGK